MTVEQLIKVLSTLDKDKEVMVKDRKHSDNYFYMCTINENKYGQIVLSSGG